MKIIKNENVLVLSDSELRDLKNAVYVAMKAEDAAAANSEADYYGSGKQTAKRLEKLYNQM